MTVGLRQGYGMSQCLCNLFMDGVMKDWRAGIMNAGVCLNERDRRQCRVNSLLYANNAECLQRMVDETAVFGRRLKVNANKRKVMSA